MQVKDELLACLKDVEVVGSFASFHAYQAATNPGLEVDSLGPIRFPLSDDDAQKIIEVSKQAPFGRKSETLVDISVRKTWELDVKSFRCKNAAWPAFLERMVNTAVHDLGVQGEVTAQPYKLLLYEPGSFFKPHKDSEKVPGMFGTLVICLSAEHEGGDVWLSHAGEKRIFQTSATSEYGISALAWYGDVTHEVKELIKGYRLVLTYNLVRTQHGEAPPTASALSERRTRIESILSAWNRNPDPPLWVYALEHKYTGASLSASALKGRDRAVYHEIREACQSGSVHVFLGQMERAEELPDGLYEDVQDPYLTLAIHDLAGRELWNVRELSERTMVQESLYEGRKADDSEDAEFAGNEGTPSILYYRDTVLIMIPQSHFRDHLLEALGGRPWSERCGLSILEYILYDANQWPDDAERKEMVQQTIRRLIGNPKNAWSGGISIKDTISVCVQALAWAAKVSDTDLYNFCLERAYTLCQGAMVPPEEIIASLSSVLRAKLAAAENDEAAYDTWLGHLFTLDGRTEILWRMIFPIAAIQDSPMEGSLAEWLFPKLETKVMAYEASLLDEFPLVSVFLERHLDDDNWLQQKYFPLLDSMTREVKIALVATANSTSLIDSAFSSWLFVRSLSYLYEREPLILGIRAEDLGKSPTMSESTKALRFPPRPTLAADVISIIAGAAEHDMAEQAAAIIEQSTVFLAAPEQPAYVYLDSLLLEGLNTLTVVAQECECVDKNAIAKLVRALLWAISAPLLKVPQPAQTWAQTPVGCGCEYCNILDDFLKDPTKQKCSFTVAPERRDHFKSKVRWPPFVCTGASKTSHKMVVHKTKFEFNREVRAWIADLGRLNDALDELRKEDMKSLIGQPDYDELVLLKGLLADREAVKERAEAIFTAANDLQSSQGDQAETYSCHANSWSCARPSAVDPELDALRKSYNILVGWSTYRKLDNTAGVKRGQDDAPAGGPSAEKRPKVM